MTSHAFLTVSRHFLETKRTYSKQRTNVNIEAQISEGRGDDLAAPVMTVLTDLGDQNARSSTFLAFKLLQSFTEAVKATSTSSDTAAVTVVHLKMTSSLLV